MADIFDLFRKIETPAAGPVSWLVVGLGNPGAEYKATRHNAGFIAMDLLAEKYGARVDRAKFEALVGEATVSGERVLLMKPQTYMNLSGNAVGAAASFYKIPPEHIIVLVDDISFAPGVLRLRRHGSHGGHNGLRNITAVLGSDQFPRFKLGVGQKPSPDYDLVDWVLGKMGKEDLASLASAAERSVLAVEKWIAGKEEEAMNLYSK